MNEEIWKDVRGYEGEYQVSNMGRVMSLNYRHTGKEKILKPRNNGRGYLFVNLHANGKHKRYFVHRLVLSTFNPCPDSESLQVNHIDEDKTNNNVDNLEWCTRSYNINHGTRNARAGEKLRGKTCSEEHKIKLSIPIVQIELATNKVVNVWGSSMAVEREYGFDHGGINKCCKNKYSREGNNIAIIKSISFSFNC